MANKNLYVFKKYLRNEHSEGKLLVTHKFNYKNVLYTF